MAADLKFTPGLVFGREAWRTHRSESFALSASLPTDALVSQAVDGAWRLSKQHIDDLQYVARGVEEADAGLRSAAGIESARAAGAAVRDDASTTRMLESESDDRDRLELVGRLLDEGLDYGEIGRRLAVRRDVAQEDGDVRLLALERWLDTKRASPASTKLNDRRSRCRRALSRLAQQPGGHHHVGVLRVVYGWPDGFVEVMTRLHEPAVSSWNAVESHPLAGLARYTDATEAVRQDLIDAAGERDFARRGMANVEAVRRWFTEEQWTVLMALRLGERRTYADRVLTSADAVRHALSEQKSKSARNAFAKSAEIDATRMLREASEEYRASWEHS